MTEEKQTESPETEGAETAETVNQAASPEPTKSVKDHIDEGIRETPRKAAVAEQKLAERMTDEDRAEMEKLIEARTSKAVNDARAKWDERSAKQMDGLSTKEEVQTEIQRALEEDRQVAQMYRKYDKTLAAQGVLPDSPEYDKVEALVADRLERGVITHKALEDQALVASLVEAAGVGPVARAKEEKDEEPAKFAASHVRPLNKEAVTRATNASDRTTMLKERMLRDLNS